MNVLSFRFLQTVFGWQFALRIGHASDGIDQDQSRSYSPKLVPMLQQPSPLSNQAAFRMPMTNCVSHLIVNISGRGDKDMGILRENLNL